MRTCVWPAVQSDNLTLEPYVLTQKGGVGMDTFELSTVYVLVENMLPPMVVSVFSVAICVEVSDN